MLMQPVGTFIIPIVLLNDCMGVMKMLQKNSWRKFVLESRLLAPFISALLVNTQRIRLTLNCRWQFVDVVLEHITENVYPGNFFF